MPFFAELHRNKQFVRVFCFDFSQSERTHCNRKLIKGYTNIRYLCLEFQLYIPLQFCSKCFSTPGKVPCCNKDGKPGKIDPKTKECEEECDCDPKDPTAPKGVKVNNIFEVVIVNACRSVKIYILLFIEIF